MNKNVLISNNSLLKNLFLPALILLLLFSVATVNAADCQKDNVVCGSDIVTDELVLDTVVDEGNSQVLKVNSVKNDDSKALKASSVVEDNPETADYNTLKGDIENCTSDEIKLTKDYKYKYSGPNDLRRIIINRSNFTIDGQGHTIDGDKCGSFFHINGDNVTLKNINFINGVSVDISDNPHGAVHMNGTGCSVEYCNFTDNGEDCGVALYFEGPAHIEGCNFINNRGLEHGAAAELKAGGIIDSSKFINNIACLGGAVYTYADLTLEDCTFEGNKVRAKNYNGGVDVFKVNDNITVTATLTAFYHNPNDFTTLSKMIHECPTNVLELTKDFVFRQKSDFGLKDGIRVLRDNFVIDGAGHTINALGVARIFNVIGNNVTFKNINFINGCADEGGAVYADFARFENCNFTNTVASYYGGAIYANQAFVDNCNFINTHADQKGGAICANVLAIANSNFDNNTAIYGGGVYSSNATMDNCTFINDVSSMGGAAYIEHNANVNNSYFADNRATFSNGGSLYVAGTAEMEGCIFENSTAAKNGGAFSAKRATIKSSNFKDCKAELGGAGYVQDTIRIESSLLEDNSAVSGGAIYSDGSICLIKNLFANNHASQNGDHYVYKRAATFAQNEFL